jgi:hypothetical protein
MTRRNRLTSQKAPAHNRRTADPYLMHQDREPRPAEKYLNGDPDAWAETPMPAPAWPTPRNRVNMPEFADTTFDHKNEQGWGDEDGEDYDNGYTRKPSDDQGNRLARVKSARRRARIALILATRMSGKRASATNLERQAYSLMQLPMRDLVAMFRNLKAEDESEDSDEEEAEDEVEVEDDKEARRRRARLQTELRRIAAEDEEVEAEEEDEDEDEEGEKEARRRLARMRRRMAADEDEEEAEDEVEDEKESRRRQARMRKLNTELTRLASMDEDEDEEEADEEEDEVEELEKEARRLAAKLRIRKLKAHLRKLKAEDESEDSDEEEAEDEDEVEDDKEARRRQALNRKRVADDLMMDEEVEADEEDMSLEDMDQDMDDLMIEADEDADMDALNALMDEEDADDAESDEFFSDDMGMTPELDLLGLDVEEPVIVAKKTRQASTQQAAPKRGVRSVGARTASQTVNPGKGGDAQLLSKLWDASPDVSAVFSRPKT